VRGQIRCKARVERVALVVIQRDIAGAKIAGWIGGYGACKSADDIAPLLAIWLE
jgi:hypothetical protein